jgi:hypothetical protein
MIRWSLTDGTNTYQFHLNPKQMGPLGQTYTRDSLPSIIGGVHANETSATKAYEWSFAGRIYLQDHYDALLEWSEKAQVLELSDHLGRTYEVILTQFAPTDLRRPGTTIRWDYEMKAIVLGRIA